MGWFSKRRFKRRKRRQRKDEAVAITSVAELDHKSSTIVVDNDDKTNTEADILQAADGREFSINPKGVWQRLVESSEANKISFDADSESVMTDNYLQVNTQSGYIKVGAMNTSHAHIYTDRSNFYFNKEIRVLDEKLATEAWVNANAGGLSESGYSRGGNNSNGYIRLSNGFMIQWYRLYSYGDRNINFTWPTAFPNACHSAWMTFNKNYANTDSHMGVYNISRTGATAADGSHVDKTLMILAVGY